MNKEKAIIIALCRCALADNPSDATRHQIVRLRDYYRHTNDIEIYKAISDLLNPKSSDVDIFKIVKSNDETLYSLIERFKGFCSVNIAAYRKWMQERRFNDKLYEITDSLGKIRMSLQDDKSTIEAWFISTKLNSGEEGHVIYEIPNETYFELAKLFKG